MQTFLSLTLLAAALFAFVIAPLFLPRYEAWLSLREVREAYATGRHEAMATHEPDEPIVRPAPRTQTAEESWW